MSTIFSAIGILALLGFSLVGTWIVLWWALPGPSERDRIVREAHARAEEAARRDPIELAHAAVSDAACDAGLERLWDAVHDAQKGDGQ